MEHRDSPGIDPELEVGAATGSRRRFARLVAAPAARKLDLPRLMVVGALVLASLILVGIGVTNFLSSMTAWVDRRPEHQIRFSQIELEPPPDPWFKGGSALILEQVRTGAKLDETVSLLELDLKALETDFRLCLWVKDVIKVDRSHHGRLVVHLAYRKPVAVVPFERARPGAFALDEEAVVLPPDNIKWTSIDGPYQVEGMVGPLIVIRNVPETSPPPKIGLPWKRKVERDTDDDRDPMVLRACRLARFLRDQEEVMDSQVKLSRFISIHLPAGPDESFFLLDSGQNWVSWGKAPGDEKPGEASAEARWNMLLKWTKVHGPLIATGQDRLSLTGTEAELIKSDKGSRKRSSPDE